MTRLTEYAPEKYTALFGEPLTCKVWQNSDRLISNNVLFQSEMFVILFVVHLYRELLNVRVT